MAAICVNSENGKAFKATSDRKMRFGKDLAGNGKLGSGHAGKRSRGGDFEGVTNGGRKRVAWSI